jgi:SNF2 family DNA or RNA helicase
MTTLKPTWPGAKYAEHQVFGISWMLQQEREGVEIDEKVVRGGILGDEMGLGKTMQSISLIVNGDAKNTLVLTPLAVRKQWELEFKKCDLNLYTAEKGEWQKHGKMKPRKSVFLAHYDKLVSEFDLFQDMGFDRIILDEAHRIRNTKTVTAMKLFKISSKVKHCWALTATPIVNELDDAVAYLGFIGCPIKSDSWRNEYQDWIQKVYLARTLDQCEAPAGLTMPPDPIVETRLLEMGDETEKDLYQGILGNIESKWRNAQKLNGRSYMLEYLSILLRLRQVSVHPGIYIKAREKEAFGWSGPNFNQMSRKFDEIQGLLRDAHGLKKTHRWIVFCQFKEEIVMLKEFLKSFDFVGSILEYHGGMNLKEREEAIQQSKIVSGDGLQDVFLIQLQAGGTGLNLQHYDRIVFISPWWTAALLNQAVGRAVRIGQKEVVKIYWLKLKDEEGRFNIDTFITEKADTKRDLAAQFLSWSMRN